MITKRFLTTGILAALSIVALTSAANAAEIYSTFGPSNGYNSNAGYNITGSGANALSAAAKFSVTQNYSLTSVDFAAAHVRGQNSFLFSIVGDLSGAPGNSVVFSTTTVVNPATQSFAATGSLVAGNTYWLVMSPAGNANTEGIWYQGTSGINGVSTRTGNGAWTASTTAPAPAFRINGNVTTASLTPEVPAGVQVIPVLLAVGGMALYQRKKKAAQN